MAYDWTPCEGCYCNKITVFDVENGKSFQPICKSYKCEKHGWMQQKRLQKALEQHFGKYQFIRMWTFTMTNRIFTDDYEHYFKLTQVWKRFITEVRRSKFLTDNQRNVQYVRVAEQHKSGFWHFHVLVDRWLDWHILQVLWNHCVQVETQITGKSGHINVKGILSAKKASYYVAKYVMKSAQHSYKRQKTWTKSSKISIYPLKQSDKTYIVYDHARHIWIGLEGLRTLTCSISKTTSQKRSLIDLFPDYIHRE